MTNWINTNTIETGWDEFNTQTQGRFAFNQLNIKFNQPGLKFNGLVDFDYRSLLYLTASKPETAWVEE